MKKLFISMMFVAMCNIAAFCNGLVTKSSTEVFNTTIEEHCSGVVVNGEYNADYNVICNVGSKGDGVDVTLVKKDGSKVDYHFANDVMYHVSSKNCDYYVIASHNGDERFVLWKDFGNNTWHCNVSA